MAIGKRAKKFKQRHLSDKIDQKKREKKHAQLINSRKRKPTGAAPRTAPKVDLNVPQTELFDNEGLDKYISDDENEKEGSDSDIAAEEAEYFQEANENEADGATTMARAPEEAELPSVIDKKVIGKWASQLRSSPLPLAQIVRAATHDELPRFSDSAALDSLRELLLEGVPAAVKQFYPSPKKIKSVRGIFKALADVLAALLADIGSGAGAATDALMRVVECVTLLLPYFTAFGREFRQLVRGLAAVVVRADRDDSVKLRAFDALRTAPMRPDVAKIAYAALVKASAKTTAFSMEGLNMAKSLFAMLFAVSEDSQEESPASDSKMQVEHASDDDEDGKSGASKEESQSSASVESELYQLAFQQIRQLALHLKTALDKTKHADYDTKVIYTWQFVQSLDFWSRCVSLSSGLRALVHPLCQVTLRVISLVPNQQFLPLRFLLLRSLVRVGHHTGVYIPLAPPLLDAVLRNTSVLSKPSTRPGKDNSTLTQPDFEVLLHVPQGYVGTQVYQNAVLDEFSDVLVESLVLYSKSIAFPELVAPITVAIRRFAKHQAPLSRNPRIRQSLVSLCERIDANTQFVLKHRAKVSFGPRDKAAIDKFMSDIKWEDTPLGKEAVVRRRVRDEKRKLAQAGMNAEQEDDAGMGGSDFASDGSDGEQEDEQEMEEALNELEKEDEEEEEEEEEEE